MLLANLKHIKITLIIQIIRINYIASLTHRSEALRYELLKEEGLWIFKKSRIERRFKIRRKRVPEKWAKKRKL